MKTRRRKPQPLPCRLATLRDALAEADTNERRTTLAAAVAEEESARRPEPGRLVRVVASKRACRVEPGLYRVLAMDAPEYGISVLDLVPADQPAGPVEYVADHFAVALRVCPTCNTAGLSEELGWVVARGCCGPCCDREDDPDNWTPN